MPGLPIAHISHAPHCTRHDHPDIDCVTDETELHGITTARITGPAGDRLLIDADATQLQTTQLQDVIDHLTGMHRRMAHT